MSAREITPQQTLLHDDGELEITIELPRADFVIERVHVWETEHAGDAYYRPEHESADLLAALKRIANEPIGDPEASHREMLEQIVEIARGAIAKARGETP